MLAEPEWFGLRLREVRDDCGLTQKELAGKSGLTLDAIAKLERGDRLPAWDTVLKLCRALSVTPDEFIIRPEAKQRDKGRPAKPRPPAAPKKRGRPRKGGGQ